MKKVNGRNQIEAEDYIEFTKKVPIWENKEDRDWYIREELQTEDREPQKSILLAMCK